MAEKKGVGHAYNIDFLNVVFAASSVFLFLSVVWMVWDDFDRDWKNTQRRFAELEYQVTQASRDQAARSVDKNKMAQLQSQRAAAEKNVTANQQKVDELQAKVDALDVRLFREQQDANFAKAIYDHDRYDFESSRAAGLSSAEAKGQGVADLEKQLHELNITVEKTLAEKAAVQKDQAAYTGEVTRIGKEIDELITEQTRLDKRLVVLAPSMVKDYFRNAPLVDFLAPTIKVQQIVLPNVVDDVNFTKVPKMDRCTTCHLAIDKKGYEKYPQPFTTHPNLSVYLGSESPHPLDAVGCTVCHEGMGNSVSFEGASHMPSTEAQKAKWEEEFHWEQPHLWDYPMLPLNATEASCAKCHKRQVLIPNAEKLNIAYATYERAGCYACHKTRGFENLRKPGPILTKIDAKLTPDWVKTWIRNPRAVKPTTWMPRIWYNSNSSAPEDAARNEAEIDAVVAYLFANTTPYSNEVKNPPRGDAKAGEQIIKSVGCLGCHVVEGKRDEVGPRRTFGQPLENIGSKTTYEWIFNWVRDPKHYNSETYMPDLRLTDGQAADVATFLVSLKQGGGDAAKATPNAAVIDAVLLDYFKASMTTADSQAELAKLDAKGKQLALGQKAIGRYGCYSCHEIKGFENIQPIGTELSEEGTKPVSRLDFAFVSDIPHTSKIGWFNRKLHNPRAFDQGRVLQPLDKLRMPNFEFSDVEVDRLVTAIMSLQREIQPPAAMPVSTARTDLRVQGRNFVSRRNCVGCHVIEGTGGDFVKTVEDPSLAPPMLTPEGARVQPDWLYAFLRGPITIRPWLNARMPTFGFQDEQVNTAISYFGAVADRMRPFQTLPAVTMASVDSGAKQLFEAMQCQKCHVLGAIPKDQPISSLAPDLRMAHDRLEPDWIVEWLKGPALILPGTKMPAFWPDYPKSPYPQFGGSADGQIKALRDYVLTFRGGPTPRTGVRNAN